MVKRTAPRRSRPRARERASTTSSRGEAPARPGRSVPVREWIGQPHGVSPEVRVVPSGCGASGSPGFPNGPRWKDAGEPLDRGGGGVTDDDGRLLCQRGEVAGAEGGGRGLICQVQASKGDLEWFRAGVLRGREFPVPVRQGRMPRGRGRGSGRGGGACVGRRYAGCWERSAAAKTNNVRASTTSSRTAPCRATVPGRRWAILRVPDPRGGPHGSSIGVRGFRFPWRERAVPTTGRAVERARRLLRRSWESAAAARWVLAVPFRPFQRDHPARVGA